MDNNIRAYFANVPAFWIIICSVFPQHLLADVHETDTAMVIPKSKWLHIRNINFIGNKITKPSIVLRDMSIKSGDSVQSDELEYELNHNKKRIINTQLFSTVKYSYQSIGSDSIDVNYEVTELLYWLVKPLFSLADRNLNVWWVEQKRRLDRTNLGADLTRVNFRGRNEKIGGLIQVGYNKYFELYYSIPFIDKKMKQGMGASITYETGREINFITDQNKLYFFRSEHYPYQRFKSKLAYTYRNRYAAIHEANISYNFISISKPLYELSPGFLGGLTRVNYFELNYIFRFNNTDIRLYPINGIELKTVISKKGLGIDKDVNQFSISNETSYYRSIYKNVSSSFIFRGRLSFPQNQPYYFNRAMGFKSEYVRGYEYYVMDGSHYALLRSNLRFKILDRILTQNILKFIKYIPLKIYSKAYDDIGFVHNSDPQNSVLNNKLLNGYGVGFDVLISYYVRLRLEYSFNHLRENALFLHSTKD
jgi:outer membrane protein assembly factor BamA